MNKVKKRNSYSDSENGLALELTPQERVRLVESLCDEVKRIQKKPWKPFFRSFPSFEALDRWKAKQGDPRLW
ncbi:MAG: hypothetical protein HYS07_10820 [Chlamydiae bacterium]|nr:hypothetical protein [Chlamydiota bacterium]MBI3276938.1 hypothetical protein [Chlamydiota bacterium]